MTPKLFNRLQVYDLSVWEEVGGSLISKRKQDKHQRPLRRKNFVLLFFSSRRVRDLSVTRPCFQSVGVSETLVTSVRQRRISTRAEPSSGPRRLGDFKKEILPTTGKLTCTRR